MAVRVALVIATAVLFNACGDAGREQTPSITSSPLPGSLLCEQGRYHYLTDRVWFDAGDGTTAVLTMDEYLRRSKSCGWP